MNKAAVIGHPIAHSLSPVLHNAAYRALGLDWQYSAFDIIPDGLSAFLSEKLVQCDDWVGFSVTMPLKPFIVPWLEGADVLNAGAQVLISPAVVATGVANTIYRGHRGLSIPTGAAGSPLEPPLSSQLLADEATLYADNTDVYGIVAALREVLRHGPVEDIAILGSGATAASALAAAKELGASKIAVFARNSDSLSTLSKAADRLGISIIEKEITEAAKELSEYDAVISTLPKYAADPIALGLTQSGGVLLDVVYDPYPTDLVATWSALGGAIVGGERMLLHQAARQVELMTGTAAPRNAMDAALKAALFSS